MSLSEKTIEELLELLVDSVEEETLEEEDIIEYDDEDHINSDFIKAEILSRFKDNIQKSQNS